MSQMTLYEKIMRLRAPKHSEPAGLLPAYRRGYIDARRAAAALAEDLRAVNGRATMDDTQIRRLMTQSGLGGTLTTAVRRFAQACAALGAETEAEQRRELQAGLSTRQTSMPANAELTCRPGLPGLSGRTTG